MVRVRFAPSPTGRLHVGNIRAALINYLFAKQQGGIFYLRIDDTDTARSKETFEQAIYADLKWLGLEWDESFKQSTRFERYHNVKQQLIDAKQLYPCFETAEELEIKRRLRLSQGKPPIYDREALKLTEAQRKAFENEGRKPHWRFKLNESNIYWKDLIRGDVTFDASQLSDPVLVREDGQFLYSLCSVIDDLDYEITHIVRGEDHVTNTATQIQLFEAISTKPCAIQFAHTSLLTGKNGEPLSKRLDSLSVQHMSEDGVEPQAINSLLAYLGTSEPIQAVSSLKPLIENFNFSMFSRTAPRFDYDDLFRLNHKLFLDMTYDDLQLRLGSKNQLSYDQWMLVRENIQTLKELEEWNSIFSGKIEPKISQKSQFYEHALACLPDLPWGKETWKNWTQKVSDATGEKGKNLFMPLRQVLTTHDHGPEMARVLPLMDRTCVEERLLWAKNHLSSQ